MAAWPTVRCKRRVPCQPWCTARLFRAAGLGRLEVVKGFFDADGNLNPNTAPAQVMEGFGMACAYGRADVVDFLLNQGLLEVDTELRGTARDIRACMWPRFTDRLTS